jgi:hypothetical protein
MTVKQAPSLVARLHRACRRALRKYRAIGELATCPSDEIRRIASDVGLSSGDLCQLLHDQHGSSDLLPRRLHLLGIDAGFVKREAPATFRDMARVCGACNVWRRCRRDLADGHIQAGMDTYCPNGATLDALIAGGDASFDSARARSSA